jgi:uncharacterized membrane protein YdjX (TVP38/TMEM64 family)
MNQVLEIFQSLHFAWLFGAMALLPLVGFPIGPLWVLAGHRFGSAWGLAMAAGAVVVNNSLVYALASRWLSQPIRNWLSRRGHHLPSLNSSDEVKLILVCRLTPGFPLFVQNYLLGCARVRFVRFLLISLPIQVGWAVALVLFGDTVTRSDVRLVLLAALAIAVSFVRKRFLPSRATGPAASLLPNDSSPQ